ncbi:uncharacterized protein [Anabrus simplex]|uniref:uncharacterized protein n=1 Tax=Anabrus simplex TaxID=316456 RepID=UPI0035A2F028
MPNKCVVRGCRSNYNSSINIEGYIRCFNFPKDPALRAEWIRAVSRSNWTPKESSVVCIKHFHPNDLSSVVKYKDRQGNWYDFHRDKPVLCDGAIPTLFPHLQSSSSSSAASSSAKRTTTEDSVEETVKRIKIEEQEIADEEDDDEAQHDVTPSPVEQVVTKIEVSSGLFEDATTLQQDVAQEMAREQEGETSTSPPTAAVYLPEDSQTSAFCESEEPLPNSTNQETLEGKSAKINKGPAYRSEEDVLNKVLEIVSTSSDDNQIFGDFVASSLRSLHSDHIRRRLKRKIQMAILEESELDERNYMAGLGTSSMPTPVQFVTFAHVNDSQNTQNIV